MSRHDGPSYTELTHQVVRESPEPLPFAEIVTAVDQLRPISTKDPKGTIRGVIGQSRLIAPTGDGRYGWRPRMLNGSVVRMTLTEDDLKGPQLSLSDELRDLLWPQFFNSGRYFADLPVELELPTGTRSRAERSHGEQGWAIAGLDNFLTWLCARNARPGDSLLFRVIDGEQRHYQVSFESRARRDEAAINERNQQIRAQALSFLRKKKGNAPIWDTIAHLLDSGAYRHEVPPDPFEQIWNEDVWGPIVDEYDTSPYLVGGLDILERFPFAMPNAALPPLPFPIQLDPDGKPQQLIPFGPIELPAGVDLESLQARLNEIMASPTPPDLAPDDPLLPVLEQIADALGLGGPEDPPDLPAAYTREGPRRPVPSPAGKKGPVKTYVLRVSYRYEPEFWRDIEIAEDQNLEDLHLAIQDALKWDDDHLYSFFMGKRPYASSTEIGSPWSDAGRHTHQVTIGSLGLRSRQKFLYLFDYGDDHLFDIQVMKINPKAPKGKYPKVVGRHGRRLEQYEEWDDLLWDDDEGIDDEEPTEKE